MGLGFYISSEPPSHSPPHTLHSGTRVYIYQWSKAIATDLMSRFRTAGLRNTDVAQAYRAKVLGSAGSRPADEMLKDFLGRPFSTAAYKKYLDTLH